MKEIRIILRDKESEKNALMCLASHFEYPDCYNFKTKGENIKYYKINLISDKSNKKDNVMMFAIQRRLDADLFGWHDFIDYNTKPKWWQFWKRF